MFTPANLSFAVGEGELVDEVFVVVVVVAVPGRH
jgi:hypothetical protein